LVVISDWSGDVLHIATVGFGDEIIENCRHLTGNANVLSGGQSCEQLDFKAFE
jgi:hypothetical protein